VADRDWLGIGAVVACAVASMATSPMFPSPRNYPAWELNKRQAMLRVEGVRLKAWISKSGKTGAGVTVRVYNCEEQARRLGIKRAVLKVEGAGERVAAARLPGPVEVKPGGAAHLYLPFSFDNERLWNQRQRSAHLRLELELDDKRHSWVIRAAHELRGYHRALRIGPATSDCPAPTKCPGEKRAPASKSVDGGTVLEQVPTPDAGSGIEAGAESQPAAPEEGQEGGQRRP
jgi:hypothetical protein